MLAALPLMGVAQNNIKPDTPKEKIFSSAEVHLSTSRFGGKTFFLEDVLKDNYHFDYITMPILGVNVYRGVGFGIEISSFSNEFSPKHYTLDNESVVKKDFHNFFVIGTSVSYKKNIPIDILEIDFSGSVSAYFGSSSLTENLVKTNISTGEITHESNNQKHNFIGVGLETTIHPIKIYFEKSGFGLGLKFGAYYNLLNFGEPQISNFHYAVSISLSQEF